VLGEDDGLLTCALSGARLHTFEFRESYPCWEPGHLASDLLLQDQNSMCQWRLGRVVSKGPLTLSVQRRVAPQSQGLSVQPFFCPV
jgi:hypothetical protein